MSHVFSRALGRDLPVVARGQGAVLWDTEGRRYLDAAGGAIVVGIGHGDPLVAAVMAEQSARVAYAHGTMFTSEALEAFADELAPLLPLDDPRVYPVSGGSEAVETALKLARSYHLARGDGSRHKVVARWGSYHGNSRGALDASGREPLRAPYAPWLGQALHVPAPYEYRCPSPSHPNGCGAWHAEQLDALIRREGPDSVACFIAEPVAGAALGAAVPTDDYWPAVAEVCRAHGVLLVADEVMTGFGRTGTLVRVRALRTAPRHPDRGQGRLVRVLAARPGGLLGRGVRDRGPNGVRPRVHLLAPRGGGRRRARPSCNDSSRATWSRRAGPRASCCARSSRPRSAITRTSATSGAWA